MGHAAATATNTARDRLHLQAAGGYCTRSAASAGCRPPDWRRPIGLVLDPTIRAQPDRLHGRREGFKGLGRRRVGTGHILAGRGLMAGGFWPSADRHTFLLLFSTTTINKECVAIVVVEYLAK